MSIGSKIFRKDEEPEGKGCLFKAFVGFLVFVIGLPLVGMVALKIHRQFETPQQIAAEDRAEAERDRKDQADRQARDADTAVRSWASYEKLYVQANVLARLKDPNSAIFGEIYVRKPEQFDDKAHGIVCGKVNSKNSFGGYTGMKFFVTYKNNLYFEPADELYRYWNKYCVKGKFF